MEHTQKGQSFTHRANKLKGKGAFNRQKQREANFDAESKGLSKKQYWKTMVKSKEDVKKFYELYHPDYPEILVNSIAAKLEEVIYKVNNKIALTEDEKKLIDNEQKANSTWDPIEDIQREHLEGKIAIASKRLEELLKDEEDKQN